MDQMGKTKLFSNQRQRKHKTSPIEQEGRKLRTIKKKKKRVSKASLKEKKKRGNPSSLVGTDDSLTRIDFNKE